MTSYFQMSKYQLELSKLHRKITSKFRIYCFDVDFSTKKAKF